LGPYLLDGSELGPQVLAIPMDRAHIGDEDEAEEADEHATTLGGLGPGPEAVLPEGRSPRIAAATDAVDCQVFTKSAPSQVRGGSVYVTG